LIGVIPVHSIVRRLALGLAAFGAAAPVTAAGDGTLVVLNKAEATASLLDLATGKVMATLPTGSAPHEAASSPDGRLVLASNYGRPEAPGSTLTVIDVVGARVEKTIELGAGRRPHGLVFVGARRALVTAEGSKALLVVDVEKGSVERAIETGQEISHMVAATPDGRRAFVANIGSGTVTAVDLATGTVLAQIPTGKGSEGIAVRPGGKEVWVANRGEDTVAIVDQVELKVVAKLSAASFPIRVAFTPDGQRALVSCAGSGDVAIFDAGGRRETGRLRAGLEPKPGATNLLGFAGGVPVGIVVDTSGRRAFVAHTNADAVAVFDLTKDALARTLAAGHEPDGMALSPLAVRKD
jgi:YVTN family beta-propeller protein